VELTSSDNVLAAAIAALSATFVHVVAVPAIVQLSAVSAPSSRSVTVTHSASPILPEWRTPPRRP
jgi:hypothetical protein